MSNSIENVWKWVVVAGAFMVHVICDGITYAFGLMLVELLDSFKDGMSLTSWIISILVGITLGSGPIAGALANHFGCRKVVIAGSIIASFGSGISYFANGVIYLIISVGVIMGFGFSLMFCPSVIIVNMYFKRRRALAVGIVVCGAGIGTFIFAPFSAYLIQVYAWRGTFLIYSGLILNGVVFASVFRLPMPYDSFLTAEDVAVEANGKVAASGHHEKPRKRSSSLITNGTNHSTPTPTYKSALGAIQEFSNSETMIPKVARFDKVVRIEPHITTRERCLSVMTVDEYKTQRRHRQRTTTDVYDVYLPLRPLEHKDIFYSGLAMHDDGIDRIETINEESDADGEARVQNGSIVEDVGHVEPGLWETVVSGLKKLTDLSLLKDPVYLIIACSNFLTNVGYDLPRIFLPDKAELEFGISKTNASWLLSTWGIANTTGRVLVGYICDQKWAIRKRLWVYTASLCFAGIINMLSPLCRNYPSLLLYSALFGISLSTYISLTSVVLVDLLGLDRLTNAFGLLLFFQGLGAIVGPPIGGWIVDSTKVYNHSFIFAGIILFISGAMLMPVAYKKRSIRKRLTSTSSKASR